MLLSIVIPPRAPQAEPWCSFRSEDVKYQQQRSDPSPLYSSTIDALAGDDMIAIWINLISI
jgi:hypothetical protein